ncbi:MAG: hypothetical protein H0X65_11345 [Gemmatimonadetes bacterium]|nr:hypothetical protein [Gemmatimonadota bacterium]
MTSPLPRSVGYTYDHHMNLTSLRDLNGQITTITYNNDALRTGERLPSGMASGHQYSSVHRTIERSYTVGQVQERLGTLYSHDDRGFVGSQRRAARDSVRSFTYGKNGRLSRYRDEYHEPTRYQECGPEIINADGEVCEPTSGGGVHVISSTQHSYDAVGNPTEGNAVVKTGNRLMSASGTAYAYDADGNMLLRHLPNVLHQEFT